MRCAIIISLVLASTVASAQEQQHPERIIPFLVQQRNDAQNSVAVCSGEVTELQRLLAEARKQIDELKAKPKAAQ